MNITQKKKKGLATSTHQCDPNNKTNIRSATWNVWKYFLILQNQLRGMENEHAWIWFVLGNFSFTHAKTPETKRSRMSSASDPWTSLPSTTNSTSTLRSFAYALETFFTRTGCTLLSSIVERGIGNFSNQGEERKSKEGNREQFQDF